jgi:hypothetical protein
MEPATLESGNAIPLLRTLGIELTEIGERHAVMEVVVEERHGNYFGGAHGGLIATLVDTVCFFPRPILPAGRLATTSGTSAASRPAAISSTKFMSVVPPPETKTPNRSGRTNGSATARQISGQPAADSRFAAWDLAFSGRSGIWIALLPRAGNPSRGRSNVFDMSGLAASPAGYVR